MSLELLLDDPATPPSDARWSADSSADRPTEPPPPAPGLKSQIGSTRSAAVRLAMAHVDLAKAEASAIGGHLARLAAFAGIAIAVLILAAVLLVVGTALFLGEWLLGSIGWGVLHGVLLFSAIAVAAILLALGVVGRRLARAFLIAAAIGAAVAVILALDAPNRLYTALGDGLVPGVEPGVRPLVVGTALGALLGLVVGAVMALRLGSGGSRIIALAGAVIVGALIGAFSAITFGVQIGIGLGLAVGYLAWIALMATEVARGGVDFDALKARFYPSQTIDTSKETLEWLQRRMPPGIGS